MNLENLCKQVCAVAKSTGAIILEERAQSNHQEIEIKGLHNFVTKVDSLAEEVIVKQLEVILPEAGFIAEEGTSDKQGDELTWIIDPIDGTTNFIHGIPAFAISIGLMKNKEMILGVVYEINADEMFYAWKGSLAYLNGQAISVSKENNMHNSLIATGFPYSEYDKIDSYLALLKYFMQNTSGLRRIGSAAVDLVYVACGRFEGFFEYNLNPWDVSAGTLIVERAGGMVTEWNGGNDPVFGRTILASNGTMHRELLDQIQHHFKA